MTYKAFEDYYKEENIRHMILHSHNGTLFSPPFATEKCKNYNQGVFIDKDVKYIECSKSQGTSKTSAVTSIGDSIWFVPYGIWDDYNYVTQIKGNGDVVYHHIDVEGQGQYYSIASDNNSAFSFPLGYKGTNKCLYIKNDKVETYKVPYEGKKLHMGTVYCNGKYWSMPRGDDAGYCKLLSFDGDQLQSYKVDVDPSITRKFSDIEVYGDKLIALPFGETKGLNDLVVFDTTTSKFSYHKICNKDFAKKYNCSVLIDNYLLALPYGDEHHNDSNIGVSINLLDYTFNEIDIEKSFGGKYRFRSGVAYNGSAYFWPTGTLGCSIIKISKEGNIIKEINTPDKLWGRPIIHNDKICVISVNIESNAHQVEFFDEDLNICKTIII